MRWPQGAVRGGLQEMDICGHIRTRSEQGGNGGLGRGTCYAANRVWRKLALLAAAILLMAPFAAGPAKAEQRLINFEEFSGPNRLTAIQPPLQIEEATISGGQIVSRVTSLWRSNRTTVYGTAHFCDGCQKTITIEFSKPVSDVSFTLMNGRVARPWFQIEDDAGAAVEFQLGSVYGAGSKRVVTLPSAGIRRLVIGQADSATAFWWQFYIDDLRYKVDEGQQYLVNFSAFVPHNNMPAGPTASCLFKGDGGWLPPGLDRVGRVPGNNAVWNRSGAFAPAMGKGKGLQQGRLPHLPGGSSGELPGNKRDLFFAGDDRGFHPAAPSYRLRQLVTVIPDQALDPDGMQEGSIRNLAGEVRAYAEDAMADGIIDDVDEDGVSDDCRLFHRAHLAETDHMNVSVTRTGPKSVLIRLSGTLDSPLAGPAEVLGAIDWDFTLTLDNSAEPGVWTLSGAHDGFPAYEIYINGQPVYQHDPGPAPYDFAKDVRKLLPPLDIAVMQVSGDLQ